MTESRAQTRSKTTQIHQTNEDDEPIGDLTHIAVQNAIDPQLQSALGEREALNNTISRCQSWLNQNLTASVAMLKRRLRDIQPLKSHFDAVQSTIRALDPSISKEAHEDAYNIFENAYYDLCTALDEEIESRSSSVSVPQCVTQTVAASHAVQLTPINIRPFNGAYTDWLPFYNTFKTLVHDQPQFNKIQKFHHLKTSVRGEAGKTINALTISEENYEVAWQLLKERFENKRLIVQHHINNLFNMEKVTKDSSSSLRQILDDTSLNLEALKSFEIKTDTWDAILIHLICSKLDDETRDSWEESQKTTEIPTKKDLTDFLTNRCHQLEARNISKSKFQSNHKLSESKVRSNSKSFNAATTTNEKLACYFCKKPHLIYNCIEFLKLSILSREAQVKLLKLCANCLRSSHATKDCTSSFTCRTCKQKHNSLLHHDQSAPSTSANTTRSPNHNFNTAINSNPMILLSTAVIHVKDKNGVNQPCRAFLDAGAQSNFILEATRKRLGLNGTSVNIPVMGINNSRTTVRKTTMVNLSSRVNSFSANIKCLVLPAITENLPSVTIGMNKFKIPENIKLADPEFNISKPVDLLLGAEIFWQLLCVGQIKIADNGPLLQKTVLGWVVGGPLHQLNYSHKQSVQSYNTVTQCKQLQDQVQKFWELDRYDIDHKPLTRDEKACEEHFVNNLSRTNDGRFQVQLPFNNNLSQLGDSFQMAKKRLLSLERKFAKNSDLQIKYRDFMSEYAQLGHMSLIGTVESFSFIRKHFFLPHHAVFKSSGDASKIRVVFDGSAKSDSDISINDAQMTGPKVQNDIFSIFIRFRSFKFAFTADICKMYRQILIHPEDRRFQQILWRDDPVAPIKVYELNTITYGTSSAPYLAIRCLRQLARENREILPEVSEVIRDDFYVDDVLTGANSIDEAIHLQKQLIDTLATARMELSKWASNHNKLVPFSYHQSVPDNVTFNCDNAKTFVGADNEMKSLINSSNFKQRTSTFASSYNIQFHFNPPAAPHMGGLWEGTVKSVKYHIKRVAGTALLSWEEMATLLVQIEACLNSRPITPLSTDPNDLSPLTPGHFLIGAPLTDIPEQDYTDVPTNRLTRWQLVSKIQQHFWRRWSKEYLGHLQQRGKWRTSAGNQVKPDDLIIIKEDNCPPLTWRMGRVVQVHPGSDGLVRVVTVRTANGLMKRPITKICVLPIEN